MIEVTCTLCEDMVRWPVRLATLRAKHAALVDGRVAPVAKRTSCRKKPPAASVSRGNPTRRIPHHRLGIAGVPMGSRLGKFSVFSCQFKRAAFFELITGQLETGTFMITRTLS